MHRLFQTGSNRRGFIKALANRAVALGLIYVLTWMPIAAHANWVQDFYNQSGATAGAGGSGAHRGQAMNLYTGGSMTMRVPNKNYQLLTLNAPRLNAMGCGGIDAFTGSFSHINKDAFVAMLKNIGQAALGQAFMLALKTLAPEVAEVMAYLQSVAQEANGLTVNSCKTASTLVSGAMGQWAETNQRTSIFASTGMNSDTDPAASERRIGGDAIETAISAANAKASLQGYKAENGNAGTPSIPEGNLLWRALTQHMGGLSNDDKQLVMSLVGTFVLDNTDPENLKIRAYPGTLKMEQLIGSSGTPSGGGAPIASSPVELLQCDTFTDDGCLNVTKATVPYVTFSQIVTNSLNRIVTAMSTRAAQDNLDINFTNLVNVPIQRILSIGVIARSPQLADTMRERYTEIIATEYAAYFVRHALDALDGAVAQAQMRTTKIESDKLEDLAKNSKVLRVEVLAQLRTAYLKGNQLMNISNELVTLEKTMYSSMPSALQSAMGFERKRMVGN
jgi:conjugative transfer pilus assembly protein TraH